jgi:hypothetical protein
MCSHQLNTMMETHVQGQVSNVMRRPRTAGFGAPLAMPFCTAYATGLLSVHAGSLAALLPSRPLQHSSICCVKREPR